SAGWYFRLGDACSLFFSACLATVPLHAASTLGANTPRPSAANATRRLIGGWAAEGVTTIKDTGSTDNDYATISPGIVQPDQIHSYSAQPSSTGSGSSVMPNTSRTPSHTVRARLSTSALEALPRFVRASACLVDNRHRADGSSG